MDTKETLNTLVSDFVPKNENFFTDLNKHIKNTAAFVLDDTHTIESFKRHLQEGNDPEAHPLYSASYALFNFEIVIRCIESCVQDEEKKFEYFEKIEQIIDFAKEMFEKVIESERKTL